MRGGNHDAKIGAHGARQHGDGGSWNGAEQQHIHANGSEARDKRGLDHVAGKPRVLADDDAVAVIPAQKRQARRLPYFHGEFRRDEAIGPSANSIRAKVFLRHAPQILLPERPVGPRSLSPLFAGRTLTDYATGVFTNYETV